MVDRYRNVQRISEGAWGHPGLGQGDRGRPQRGLLHARIHFKGISLRPLFSLSPSLRNCWPPGLLEEMLGYMYMVVFLLNNIAKPSKTFIHYLNFS